MRGLMWWVVWGRRVEEVWGGVMCWEWGLWVWGRCL